MYATTTTGHRPHVTKSADTRVLQQMVLGNSYGRIIQKTETTVEEWLGLKWSDAESLTVASETSVLNGATRQFLGAAKLTMASGGVSTWCTVEGCWGTRVTTQCARMGDTNHYQVTRTTQVLTVTNVGGTMELL